MSWRRPTISPEQRAEERRARIAAQVPPSGRLHRGVMGGGTACAAPKPQTYTSAKWLAAVRSIECCVRCGRHGTEPAHRNEGKGTGLKTHDCCTAALCRECHRELDQGMTLSREEKRAEMDRCIVLTLAALAQAGKVRPA